MKSYAILTLLMLLAACSKGNNSKSQNEIENKSQEQVTEKKEKNNLSYERGMVSIRTEQGETVDIDLNTPSLSLTSKNILSKKIILKVDGDQVYTLIEETDLSKNITNKYVSLKIENPIKYVEDLLKENRGHIEKGILYYDETLSLPYEFNGHELQTEVFMQNEVNMKNPNCDSTIFLNQNYTLIANGIEDGLYDLKSTIKSSCGKPLTSDELQELDLSSITFCDNSEQGLSKCKKDQNLEHLTSDL